MEDDPRRGVVPRGDGPVRRPAVRTDRLAEPAARRGDPRRGDPRRTDRVRTRDGTGRDGSPRPPRVDVRELRDLV